MRRPIICKTERMLRWPASASMSVQPVSRTTLASFTRLRWGSCQAKSTINQCCSSTAISLAYSSHKTRQASAVCHSSTWPCCFHNLYNNSICQRSRSSTRASSKRKRLTGASVTSIVQSASCKVSSLMVCPRRCASRRKSSRRLSATSLGTRSMSKRMGSRSLAPTSTRSSFICPTRRGSTCCKHRRWPCGVESAVPACKRESRVGACPMPLGQATLVKIAQVFYRQTAG